MFPLFTRGMLTGAAVLISAVTVEARPVAHTSSSAGSVSVGAPATRDPWRTAGVLDDTATADRPLSAAAASAGAVSDSADAVAVVTGFHAAMARGDSAAVLKLLAPDVIIMEGGGIESLVEYRSHHLAADVAFARAIPGVHTLKGVVVRGDAAWVSSTSVVEGQFNGRSVSSAGAELVVLSRRDVGSPWIIRAVHWSSRRRAS